MRCSFLASRDAQKLEYDGHEIGRTALPLDHVSGRRSLDAFIEDVTTVTRQTICRGTGLGFPQEVRLLSRDGQFNQGWLDLDETVFWGRRRKEGEERKEKKKNGDSRLRFRPFAFAGRNIADLGGTPTGT